MASIASCVVVLVGESDARANLAAAIEAAGNVEVLFAPTLRTAEELVRAVKPVAVVTDPAIPADEALQLAGSPNVMQASSGVIMVVQRVTTELFRAAMRAGVRDVVPLMDGVSEITAAVQRVCAEASDRPETGVSIPAEKRARVVSVFSTKGGVGKSTISTNLAVALTQQGRSVALLDLDLQFGDVAVMLQLNPDRTIHDVVQAGDRLDVELLKGFLVKHSSGTFTLLAPVRPELAEDISSEDVGRIIDLLATTFDSVVIDTAPAFTEAVLAALDRSDDILVVGTNDVPSVKNMKVSLQKLGQLGYDAAVVRPVLNRADSKVFLEASEIEKALGVRIAAKIPSDRVVPRCINKGVPVVVDEPRTQVAKSFVALAKELATPLGVRTNVA